MTELPIVIPTLSEGLESRDNIVSYRDCYFQENKLSDLEPLLMETTDSKEECMLFRTSTSRNKTVAISRIKT